MFTHFVLCELMCLIAASHFNHQVFLKIIPQHSTCPDGDNNVALTPLGDLRVFLNIPETPLESERENRDNPYGYNVRLYIVKASTLESERYERPNEEMGATRLIKRSQGTW